MSNNNTGGGCMVVEMYAGDSYGPRIIALDADFFGNRADGTMPTANTFYVCAFTGADDEAGTVCAYEVAPDEVARLFAEWWFIQEVECPTPSV